METASRHRNRMKLRMPVHIFRKTLKSEKANQDTGTVLAGLWSPWREKVRDHISVN